MATWEDGPEYAPIARPDEFSVPDVAPLGVAEPYVQPAANAPVDRPRFGDPQTPVAPLADLVPQPEVPRDPTIPYEVVSSAMTSGDSAWTAAHWSQPTSPITTSASPWISASGSGAMPTGTSGPTGSWPTGTAIPTGASGPSWPSGPSGLSWPTGTSWPNGPSGTSGPSGLSWPSGPSSTSGPNGSGRPTGPTGLPAPGTDQWFGPTPYAPAPPPAPVFSAKDVVVAVTPALLIVLAVGALIHPVAPITLLVAWVLSTRATVAKPEIRIAFVIAVATVAVVGLLIGFVGAVDFAAWWSGLAWVALILSWGMIVAVVVLAKRAFDAGERPPARPSTWG